MSLRRHIDKICDEFEARWKAGEQPSLHDFIQQITKESRPALAKELIPLDVECRAVFGSVPDAVEYAMFGDGGVRLAQRVIDTIQTKPQVDGGTASHDAEYAETFIRNKTSWNTADGNAPDDISPQIGPYRLLQKIGKGGMGVVYKAHQVKLNRTVALKMILTGNQAGDDEIARFHAEAEAAAHLDHPNIVPIYEIGEHDGQHFFSMAFVEGISLATQLKDGPMTPRAAAALVKIVTDAIVHAHRNGVIHRDLKPENVLLDVNGHPHVTDFGLAKRMDRDSGMTATGQILGTPSFMPPEQASGKQSEVGEGSDVYSLGAILYATLTGRPPFQADNALNTLMHVLEQEPVAPRQLIPQIPVDLETISLECLQKDIGRRYPTAAALSEELRRFLAGEPIAARRINRGERTWRWCRRNPWPTLVGVVVLFFAVFATTSALTLRHRLWQSLITQARAERLTGNRDAALTLLREAAEIKQGPELRQQAIESIVSPGVSKIHELTIDKSHSDFRISSDGARLYCGNGANRSFETHKCYSLASGESIDKFDALDFESAQTEAKKIRQTFEAASGNTLHSISANSGFGIVLTKTPSVQVWNIPSMAMTCELKIGCTHARLSPGGSVVACFHDEAPNQIKLFLTNDGTPFRNLETATGTKAVVGNFSFNSDASMLVAPGSEGINGLIRVWDVSSGEITAEVDGEGGPQWAGTTRIVSTARGYSSRSSGPALTVWQVSRPTPTIRWDTAIHHVSFGTTGGKVAINGSLLSIHQSENDWLIDKFVENGVEPWAFWGPDGTTLFVDAADRGVPGWSAPQLTLRRDDGEQSQTLALGERFGMKTEAAAKKWRVVNDVSWDAKSQMLCTVSRVNREHIQADPKSSNASIGTRSHETLVELWDATTGARVVSLTEGVENTNDFESVDFGPSGDLIATGSREVVVWDLATKQRVFAAPISGTTIPVLCFNATGTSIIAAPRESASITVINATDGTFLSSLGGHENGVSCMAAHPDGKILASGSADQTVRLWNTETDELLASWKAHDSTIGAMGFSPDGSVLVTGSSGGVAKVWSMTKIRNGLAELGMDWENP